MIISFCWGRTVDIFKNKYYFNNNNKMTNLYIIKIYLPQYFPVKILVLVNEDFNKYNSEGYSIQQWKEYVERLIIVLL